MSHTKKVNHLISQMRTAVDTAKALSAATPVPSFNTTAAPPIGLDSRASEGAESPALMSLISELMAGVENRFGIKPGTLVERKLVRIFKDMPVATLRDWVQSMNSCSPELKSFSSRKPTVVTVVTVW